jgi:hypothetical protein
MMIALPLATSVGAFAGSAFGCAVGDWLQHAGLVDAIFWCGRFGGLLGAMLCPAYVARKVIKDERAITKTQTKQRETQTS